MCAGKLFVVVLDGIFFFSIAYNHWKMASLTIANIFIILISTSHAFNLTILHTNDVHARIQEMNAFGGQCSGGDCFGGAARMKTKIEELRKEHPNTLLLDAGDQFQGTLWFTHYGGRVTYRMMNLLGYDVMVSLSLSLSLSLKLIRTLYNLTIG